MPNSDEVKAREPWFASLADEAPMLDEAAAIFAAVDVFHRKLHPRKPRNVNDLNRLIDEMTQSAARVRAVSRPKNSHD